MSEVCAFEGRPETWSVQVLCPATPHRIQGDHVQSTPAHLPRILRVHQPSPDSPGWPSWKGMHECVRGSGASPSGRCTRVASVVGFKAPRAVAPLEETHAMDVFLRGSLQSPAQCPRVVWGLAPRWPSASPRTKAGAPGMVHRRWASEDGRSKATYPPRNPGRRRHPRDGRPRSPGCGHRPHGSVGQSHSRGGIGRQPAARPGPTNGMQSPGQGLLSHGGNLAYHVSVASPQGRGDTRAAQQAP